MAGARLPSYPLPGCWVVIAASADGPGSGLASVVCFCGFFGRTLTGVTEACGANVETARVVKRSCPASPVVLGFTRVTSHARRAVKPVDIQTIGDELAVKWDDGSESYVALEKLRRGCPCAGCKGEVDIMGNVYKNPDQPLPPQAFQLVRVGNVGGYALQPFWGDGHATGIYSFEYLRHLVEAA